jgi:hypothetical protein
MNTIIVLLAHTITAFNLLGNAVFIYKNPGRYQECLESLQGQTAESTLLSEEIGALKWHLHQQSKKKKTLVSSGNYSVPRINEKNLIIAAQSAQITQLSYNLEEQRC